MKYKTITSPTQSKITIKGSKFLGFAYPVDTIEEVESKLHNIRKKYYDATHHCYAWQLESGIDMTFRYNDDGEPSGTAGKPLYGVIQRLDITNVLVISVRYFGGTKLGTGGLIKAYGQSASDTLNEAKIKTVVKGDKLQFICSYEHHPVVAHCVNQYDLISFSQEFTETVRINLEVEEHLTKKLLEDVKNKTNGVVIGDVIYLRDPL